MPVLCVPDALAGVWELLEENLLEGTGGTFPMPTHLPALRGPAIL